VAQLPHGYCSASSDPECVGLLGTGSTGKDHRGDGQDHGKSLHLIHPRNFTKGGGDGNSERGNIMRDGLVAGPIIK
jgi:hypothetical protein